MDSTEKTSTIMGIDQVNLVKVLNFLPYPFLVSESRNGASHSIFVNQKFIDEIGYTCEDIPTIQDWYFLAYPDPVYRLEIIADWQHKLTEAQSAGNDSIVKQAKIMTRHFGEKWYEVKASAYGPISFVAFVNIDDDVRREQNLQVLNENKDRILSILSHDLRSPLNNLHSILQLISHNSLTETEKEGSLRKLDNQIFHMREFLDTTLQWTRINFNELRSTLETVDVKQITLAIANLYHPSSSDKNLTVSITLDSDLPLRSDPAIVSILIRNIISNAIKYTPASGYIHIHDLHSDGTYTFSVENSGFGISEEKIQEIQNKHYTSEIGTQGEKGLGLGLRLCQQLLETIGGKLEIESPDPATTVFRIILKNALSPKDSSIKG